MIVLAARIGHLLSLLFGRQLGFIGWCGCSLVGIRVVAHGPSSNEIFFHWFTRIQKQKAQTLRSPPPGPQGVERKNTSEVHGQEPALIVRRCDTGKHF